MKSVLKDRVKNGILAAVVLIAALFFVPSWLFLILLMAICALGMLEFYLMLDAALIPNFRFLGIAGALAMLAAVWLEMTYQIGGQLSLLVLFAVLCAIFIRQMPQKNNSKPFETVAGTLLGIMYVGFLLTFIIRVMIVDGQFEGQWLFFYLLAVVKIGDTGAFFAGSTLGRHKMSPRLSPNKSWEGFVGGMIAGMLASLAIYHLREGEFCVVNLRVVDAVVLGILLPLAGTLGDLFESLLKRAAKIKDSSAVLKGLGGILDLTDSVLLGVPVLYFWIAFMLP